MPARRLAEPRRGTHRSHHLPAGLPGLKALLVSILQREHQPRRPPVRPPTRLLAASIPETGAAWGLTVTMAYSASHFAFAAWWFRHRAPGAGGSMGYADPTNGIGYGYVTNRMGMKLNGDPRDIALREAIPTDS